MKVYRYENEFSGEIYYSLMSLNDAWQSIECESVVYAREDYRMDACKGTYIVYMYSTREKCEKVVEKANKMFREDEYCNWASRVVLLPVF